jgi:cytochrome P450
VRIAPNELHLSDPENYNKIYSIGGKYYKDPVFYSVLGDKYSGFATISNEDHRRRRAPLNPFFSRRTVLELENVVHDKVAKLCRLVENAMSRGQSVDLHTGFRAISMDVITEYAFDDCWDQLDREDLGDWFSEMVKNSGETFWIMQQFPYLLKLVKAIPPQVLRKLSPTIKSMLDCKDVSKAPCHGAPVMAKHNLTVDGRKPSFLLKRSSEILKMV